MTCKSTVSDHLLTFFKLRLRFCTSPLTFVTKTSDLGGRGRVDGIVGRKKTGGELFINKSRTDCGFESNFYLF